MQYVDNAYNRRLGRVGMTHGTAVVSRSNGGCSGYSGSTSNVSRQYVDNATNRRLGRVGMDHGTAVFSRASTDNAFNQRESRVGSPIRSAVIPRSDTGCASRSSVGSSVSSYVDNELNRRLGRVGLERGTAVHSTSTTFSQGSTKRYVDNAMNRSLGRVGMEHGTAIFSKSSGGGNGSGSFSSGYSICVDNAFNQRESRVGLPIGSAVISRSGSGYAFRPSVGSSISTYVDNELNRRLGRVGLERGTAVHSKSSTLSQGSSKRYVDNALNRSLGRVGMVHGTAVFSRCNGGGNHCGNGSGGFSSGYSTCVDNAFIQREGRVGLPIRSVNTLICRSGTGFSSGSSDESSVSSYVDNELDCRLGRAGLEKGTQKPSRCKQQGRIAQPHGTAVQPKPTVINNRPRVYTDNAANRHLGRVGKPLGSMPASKTRRPTCTNFNQNCEESDFDTLRGKLSTELIDHYRNETEAYVNLIKAKKDKTPPGNKMALTTEQLIDFKELALGDKIGAGGFGDVHIGKWRESKVAIKKLRVQRVSQKLKKQFEDEVKSFSKLDHPNIVKFYGACIETPNLAIVMEFMPDRSLYDNLHTNETQFSDSDKNSFIIQLFSALSYLHSRNMVHRDIKSSNILLCDDLKICKLADFGLALKENTEAGSTVRNNGFAGTYLYCPHEILEGDILTVAELKLADVYSLGLTVVELLTEKVPFDGMTVHQIRKVKRDGGFPSLDGISSPMNNLLMQSLCIRSDKRPDALQFLNATKKILATN